MKKREASFHCTWHVGPNNRPVDWGPIVHCSCPNKQKETDKYQKQLSWLINQAPRYGAALAFLVGESPDSCQEDPKCDQTTLPFWQVADDVVDGDDDDVDGEDDDVDGPFTYCSVDAVDGLDMSRHHLKRRELSNHW